MRYIVFCALIDGFLRESRCADFILLWSLYEPKVNFQSQDTQAFSVCVVKPTLYISDRVDRLLSRPVKSIQTGTALTRTNRGVQFSDVKYICALTNCVTLICSCEWNMTQLQYASVQV